MRIRFDRGTLVLEPEHAGDDPSQIPRATWDPDVHAWRVPADRYRSLLDELAARGIPIVDEVRMGELEPDWQLPALRWYQQAALEAWRQRGREGLVVLPTGSGKTLVALAAMARLGVATLVLVPTRVLLDQWARAIAAYWPHPIGRLGDGDHEPAAITVSTYASATSWMPRLGERFGLVVVDEAHHVGAWCPTEVLEMIVAPARLGLTATPPDAPSRLGPIVFALGVEELKNDGLSDFELVELPIQLEPQERARYRQLRGRFGASYAPFVRSSPRASWAEYVTSARRSMAGRAALSAWRDSRALVAYPAGKREALKQLLERHRGERTLVFTGDNATAYAIARELLVTPITHEIGRAERARALDRFRRGDITVLVSAQVLDEGLDVPDADIAIVVGGTASQRRHVQRIGRVLRPRSGKKAVIYELSVGDTVEVDYVKRRRAGLDVPLNGGVS